MTKEIVPLLLLCLVAPSFQIFVPDYFEQTCRKDAGFVTQSSINWIANLTLGTPLYLPIQSSLNAVRLAQDLYQTNDLKFLSFEEMVKACVIVPFTKNAERLTGYCDRIATRFLTVIGTNIRQWNATYTGGVGGVFRISLTDSKSWQVLDICWDDGQRSFVVVSLFSRLSVCTRRVIIEHLKAIGFQEKFFINSIYNTEGCSIQCPAKQNILA